MATKELAFLPAISRVDEADENLGTLIAKSNRGGESARSLTMSSAWLRGCKWCR